MHKINHEKMVKKFYSRAFNSCWGELWYLDVIEPIVESVQKNEKLYLEKEENYFSNVDDKFYEEIIETQIGMVLVLSQSYISHVIGQVDNFQSDLNYLYKNKNINLETSKRGLMAVCSEKYENTKYSKVEAIDYLANYFKHHSEWSDNKPQSSANRTKQAVTDMGLNIKQTLWFSRNLSKGIKGLGITRLSELPKVMTIIDDWKRELGHMYKSKGLFRLENA